MSQPTRSFLRERVAHRDLYITIDSSPNIHLHSSCSIVCTVLDYSIHDIEAKLKCKCVPSPPPQLFVSICTARAASGDSCGEGWGARQVRPPNLRSHISKSVVSTSFQPTYGNYCLHTTPGQGLLFVIGLPMGSDYQIIFPQLWWAACAAD